MELVSHGRTYAAGPRAGVGGRAGSCPPRPPSQQALLGNTGCGAGNLERKELTGPLNPTLLTPQKSERPIIRAALPPLPLHKAPDAGECQLKGQDVRTQHGKTPRFVPTPLCLPLSTGTHSHKEEAADVKKSMKTPQQWLRWATVAALVASAAAPSFELCHLGQLTAGNQRKRDVSPEF